jgi:hypothetical protein
MGDSARPTALLAARSGHRGYRSAAAFLDPDLDSRNLDLIWWNGARSHRVRSYGRATCQKRVRRTIRAPSTPAILTPWPTRILSLSRTTLRRVTLIERQRGHRGSEAVSIVRAWQRPTLSLLFDAAVGRYRGPP